MNIELLKAVAVASASSAGFGHFAPNAELKELSDAGYITVNLSESDNNGHVGARINEAGEKHLSENSADNGGAPNGTNSTTKPKAEKQTFAVTTMPKPEIEPRTRASGGSKYPFDSLAAPNGDDVSAFYVAATEEMPDPAKSLTSAVSQANRRYANVVGKNAKGHDIYAHVRKFRIKPDVAEDGTVKGAWVWRDVDGSGEAETDDEQAEAENNAQG